MRSLAFLFREFLQSLQNERMLLFTHGAQATVSLLVLGIFFVLLVGCAVFWNKLGEQMDIHVFLEEGLSSMQINQMEEQFNGLEHVRQVTFRDKQKALEIFSRQNSSIKLEDLEMDNPLPNSFVISVDSPANISDVVDQLTSVKGILNIRYGEQILERYIKVLMVLMLVCAVTIGLLLLFTYSSINNIIALSVYARRNEIRIMQLVGATWWFIRWPFLFEGIFFGLGGALVAFLIILLLLSTLNQALKMNELSMVIPALGIGPNEILTGLLIILVGLGVGVGLIGSFKAVNAYLRRESALQAAAKRVQAAMRF